MMTQPIQMFENLTSETTPVGGNASKAEFSFEQRRALELRARYERAEFVAGLLTDGLIWVGRQATRLIAAAKAEMKSRAAEDQLRRMTDRELTDLGLARADIEFAVRHVSGEMPRIVTATADVTAANQNLRNAA